MKQSGWYLTGWWAGSVVCHGYATWCWLHSPWYSRTCGGEGLSFIDTSLTRSGPQYYCTHMETEHDPSGGQRLVSANDLAASLLLIQRFGPQLVVSLFASISAAPHKGLKRKRLGCRMSPDTDVEGDIDILEVSHPCPTNENTAEVVVENLARPLLRLLADHVHSHRWKSHNVGF